MRRFFALSALGLAAVAVRAQEGAEEKADSAGQSSVDDEASVNTAIEYFTHCKVGS